VGNPLVSVITPVLNRVETMGACIASIARQTYRPIEHIVVDGGSTDGMFD
jgi:glycosyltransferase